MHAFVQISERSFYNAEIIKESKTGMGVLPECRNGQTYLQRPLPKMSERLQAKFQGDYRQLSEIPLQKKRKKRTQQQRF